MRSGQTGHLSSSMVSLARSSRWTQRSGRGRWCARHVIVSTSHLLAYVYAIAIGLLLGAERERRQRKGDRAAFGVRTFALLAITGTLCANLGGWVVVGGLAAVAALVLLGYWRTSRIHPGTTTEVSALATYLLGALSYRDAALAAALAIAIAVRLASKAQLHRFVRSAVSDIELQDALKFLVVAFVVLPILPKRGIGPYGVLNPSRIWLIVVTLTGISWLGYIAVRALGPRLGLLAAGLASGFVSATATTASMGRLSRTTGQMTSAVASAQLASVATFVQLGLVMVVVSPSLALRLVVPIILGVASLSLIGWLGYRKARAARAASSEAQAPVSGRPFSLLPALVLAAILTAALLVGRWGSVSFGPRGAVIAAGAAGLADAHGGALSAATLFAHGNLAWHEALWAIGAAIGSNSVVKCVVALATGGAGFARRFAVGVVLSVAVFLAALGVVIAVA
jgi:uncharacterized membrane protein (DUF4010 family)